MQSYISILQEVRDPRDMNARHPVETILFLTLAATLCGAKSCVEVAEFAADREEELSEIVELPYGAPRRHVQPPVPAARSNRIGQGLYGLHDGVAGRIRAWGDAGRCGGRRQEPAAG